MENSENAENKKETEVVYKEESMALKENNETPKEKKKKKKSKKISLEKLNLGTKPINISTSNDFINFKYIYYFMKSRIRMILYIIAGVIALIILLTLKGLFSSEVVEENSLKDENDDKNEVLPAQENKSVFPKFNLTHKKKSKKKKKHDNNNNDEDDDKKENNNDDDNDNDKDNDNN